MYKCMSICWCDCDVWARTNAWTHKHTQRRTHAEVYTDNWMKHLTCNLPVNLEWEIIEVLQPQGLWVCVFVCESERHTHTEREHKASNRRGLYLCKTYCTSFNDTELRREETLLTDINHVFLYRKCSAIELYKVNENCLRHFFYFFYGITV